MTAAKTCCSLEVNIIIFFAIKEQENCRIFLFLQYCMTSSKQVDVACNVQKVTCSSL